VPPGLQLGIDQGIIHRDLIAASLGGGKGDALDLRLVVFEQFICQANGPVCIVSDNAINDSYF
jgi:hypothetical protein